MGMFLSLIVTASVGWWDFVMIIVLTTFLPAHWLERLVPPLRRTAASREPVGDAQ
jgi:hypothetical protein